MLQILISISYLFVAVLYSYSKHGRIVRFSNESAMMHGLDRLLISLTHDSVLITFLSLFFL